MKFLTQVFWVLFFVPSALLGQEFRIENEKGLEELTVIYKVSEVLPMFSDCLDNACSDKKIQEILNENMEYPPVAFVNGLQGRVIVKFVIDKNGNFREGKVLRDIGAGSGTQLLSVLKKMPKWQPGKQRGKEVNVQVTLQVAFKVGADHYYIYLQPKDDPDQFKASAKKQVDSAYLEFAKEEQEKANIKAEARNAKLRARRARANSYEWKLEALSKKVNLCEAELQKKSIVLEKEKNKVKSRRARLDSLNNELSKLPKKSPQRKAQGIQAEQWSLQFDYGLLKKELSFLKAESEYLKAKEQLVKHEKTSSKTDVSNVVYQISENGLKQNDIRQQMKDMKERSAEIVIPFSGKNRLQIFDKEGSPLLVDQYPKIKAPFSSIRDLYKQISEAFKDDLLSGSVGKDDERFFIPQLQLVFSVDRKGKVKDVFVYNHWDFKNDDIVERMVTSFKEENSKNPILFEPAQLNGKPIQVYLCLPFTLYRPF